APGRQRCGVPEPRAVVDAARGHRLATPRAHLAAGDGRLARISGQWPWRVCLRSPYTWRHANRARSTARRHRSAQAPGARARDAVGDRATQRTRAPDADRVPEAADRQAQAHAVRAQLGEAERADRSTRT